MAFFRPIVKYDASRAFNKMNKEARRIKQAGHATVRELVDLGVSYAQQYVPKDSYTTFRSIKGKVNERQKGSDGTVMIEERTVPDASPRKGSAPRTTHDLAYFMANGLSGRGRGGYNHFNRGSPRFMKNTRNYLNEIKKQIGNKNIKKGNSSFGTSV